MSKQDKPKYQRIRETATTWIVWFYEVETDHTSWERVGRVIYDADGYYYFEHIKWKADGYEFERRITQKFSSPKVATRAFTDPKAPPEKLFS